VTTPTRKTLAIALATLLLSVSVTTMADSDPSTPKHMHKAAWAKKHPRRVEVNGRLAHQNQRIKKEVKEGDLSKTQAAQLHKDDRHIRQEERNMAAQDGGHITKQEQGTLNRQESAVSKQIGQ
jgi:Spy/CpxP family protein refolding chaperone